MHNNATAKSNMLLLDNSGTPNIVLLSLVSFVFLRTILIFELNSAY